MTTIANIAQRVLDENNYSNPSLTQVEYLIDNAIDYINAQAGISIADLSGDVESKSLTGTDSQIFVVKTLSALLLRSYHDKGPNVGIQAQSVVAITSDPQYVLFMKLIDSAIERLKDLPIVIANDPLPNE